MSILYAGTKGFLDKYPIEVIAKYETGLYQFLEERYPQIFSDLAEKKEFTEEIDDLMQKALTEYDEEFANVIK